MDENKKTTEMLTDETLKKVTGGTQGFIEVKESDCICGGYFEPVLTYASWLKVEQDKGRVVEITHKEWMKRYWNCKNCMYFLPGSEGVGGCENERFLEHLLERERIETEM